MADTAFPKELWGCWRDLTVAYNTFARQAGVDTSELYVVDALWNADGGLTQREIGELCDMGKQTVSVVCKRLEARADICLQQSRTDKRAKIVVLTSDGRARWWDAIEKMRACEASAVAGISKEDADHFMRICKRYTEAFVKEVQR